MFNENGDTNKEKEITNLIRKGFTQKAIGETMSEEFNKRTIFVKEITFSSFLTMFAKLNSILLVNTGNVCKFKKK